LPSSATSRISTGGWAGSRTSRSRSRPSRSSLAPFNLTGQVAITASIDYGAATFTTALLNLVFGYNNDNHHIIYVYIAILVLHALMNIFSVKLVASLNDVSAYWHVLGVAIIALVLIIAPAVCLIAFLAFVLAAPAWSGVAFFVYAAVTSVATIGLYVAYIIPVYLRFRLGDEFEAGPWNLGPRYKFLNIVAMIWVAFICILFILPVTDLAVPWNDDFDYKSMNYAPIVFLVVLGSVAVWWNVSAKKWFKGPQRNFDVDELATPDM
jgi:amino acid transporter